jgi:putative membrane protein
MNGWQFTGQSVAAPPEQRGFLHVKAADKRQPEGIIMKFRIAAALLATTFLIAPAGATERLGMGTPNATQFRAKASSSDAFEVLSSKIALTHATTPELKDFARMMITDHTASTDKLVALGGISKKSLKTKMEPGSDGKWKENDLLDSSHADELNSLDSKSNGDFNKTYIDDQVNGHKDMVSLLEDYAKNGDNAKLKQFASDILPTVREHLAKAQQIQHMIER